MKRKIMYALILLLLVLSCRKEQQKASIPGANDAKAALSLDEVKAAYQGDTTNHIHWDKAVYVTGKNGGYWLIGLDGRPNFQSMGLGYRQLLFSRDNDKKIKMRILETIPDAIYLQRKQQYPQTGFTGRLFVYDNDYHLLSGKTFVNGKQIGQIKPADANAKPLKTEMIAPVTECTWVDNNYVDGDGNAVIYSEQICATSYIDLGGDVSSSGGGGFPAGSPGDPSPAGGGAGPAPAPEVSNLPGENKSGINPKDYMKCFQNIPDNGATMTVTIYVQEPEVIGKFIIFAAGNTIEVICCCCRRCIQVDVWCPGSQSQQPVQLLFPPVNHRRSIVIDCQRVALRITNIPGGQAAYRFTCPIPRGIISVNDITAGPADLLDLSVYRPVNVSHTRLYILIQVTDLIIGIVPCRLIVDVAGVA
jgi:hypothetical protein